MDRKAKYIVVVVLVVAIVVFITLYSWFWLFYNAPEPPPIHPFVLGTMEKVDGNYNMTVVEASDFGLKLDDVEVEVVNSSGNIIFRQTLNYLVHNGNSDIIFYDKDNNNSISEGDVLTIKGNIADQGCGLLLASISEKTVVYHGGLGGCY